MSKTSIEWCAKPGTLPETWNPVTGCNKVSQGCKNCYAEIMHRRLQKMFPEKYDHDFLSGAHEHEQTLLLPLKWKKPRTVFVNSMSDLFHENVSFNFIAKVFDVICNTPQHTYIIVTKRASQMMDFVNSYYRFNQASIRQPLQNVWLLVSVEDQQAADERIPFLLQTPAAVRGLSCEPLLGPVDFLQITGKDFCRHNDAIQWVIAGGESGHKARPMHPDWTRDIRDQCTAANIPFFFKQWGEWKPVDFKNSSSKARDIGHFSSNKHFSSGCVNPEHYGAHNQNMHKVGKHASGRLLDGKEWNEFPEQDGTLLKNNA